MLNCATTFARRLHAVRALIFASAFLFSTFAIGTDAYRQASADKLRRYVRQYIMQRGT